jgi:hypothetical protein
MWRYKPHAEMPCSSEISVSYRAKTENPIKTAPGLNQFCDSALVPRFVRQRSQQNWFLLSALPWIASSLIQVPYCINPLCTEVTITTWELEPSGLDRATAARRRYFQLDCQQMGGFSMPPGIVLVDHFAHQDYF